MEFKINFLREGPTNYISFRPHKTSICLWCSSLFWVFSYWPYSRCKLGIGSKWEPALILFHWFFSCNLIKVLGESLVSFIRFGLLFLQDFHYFLGQKYWGSSLSGFLSFQPQNSLASSPCWSTLIGCEENWPVPQRIVSSNFPLTLGVWEQDLKVVLRALILLHIRYHSFQPNLSFNTVCSQKLYFLSQQFPLSLITRAYSHFHLKA